MPPQIEMKKNAGLEARCKQPLAVGSPVQAEQVALVLDGEFHLFPGCQRDDANIQLRFNMLSIQAPVQEGSERRSPLWERRRNRSGWQSFARKSCSSDIINGKVIS